MSAANWCSASDVSTHWVCGKCGARPSPDNPVSRWFLDEDPKWVRCDRHHPYNGDDEPMPELNLTTESRYLGGCNCVGKTPTVPVFRDPMTHLDDCPAKDSGYPVGSLPIAPQAPAPGGGG
jgi:hypothetical protein